MPTTQSTPPTLDAQLLAAAREVLRSESASIASIADILSPSIAHAITLIHERTSEAASPQYPIPNTQYPGGVVLSGIGKSGLVAQRLSASFASTGTPSHFLHPVEALHGDLGRVRRNDTALLLSYSGETDELVRLLDSLKRQQIPLIVITSSIKSTLGKLADITVELGPIEEVCPHGLAPTTTVNCLSAVGDALVLGVMSLRKFSKEDFAAFHPAGSLGRKLLKVHQAMEFKTGENFTPLLDSLTVQEVLNRDTPTGRRAGAVVLINSANQLSGVFTDGDLRRNLKSTPNLLATPISHVMTKNPKHIHQNALASEALALFNKYRIDELPVIDDAHHPTGLIDVQDLVRLRIVE
jgi:arabinose-5-phosphate isomerase